MQIYPSSETSKNFAFSELIPGEELVFEGFKRPDIMRILHESDQKSPNDSIILERYFADIQNLFLKKLSTFSSEGDVSGSGQDGAKLRLLLEEMIKVKTLISKAG